MLLLSVTTHVPHAEPHKSAPRPAMRILLPKLHMKGYMRHMHLESWNLEVTLLLYVAQNSGAPLYRVSGRRGGGYIFLFPAQGGNINEQVFYDDICTLYCLGALFRIQGQ